MSVRSLRSPLLGTALVSAALAMLAIPLHNLTSQNTPPPSRHAPVTESSSTAKTRSTLRIRSIDGLSHLSVETMDGGVLYRSERYEPGETEVDVEIPLEHDSVEIRVRADAGAKETALFITLLPDGLEESTAYAIGSGSLDETLHFHWPHDHE